MLVAIAAIGLFFAYAGRNLLPLVFVFFAMIFLSADLTKELGPTSRNFLGRLGLSALSIALVVVAFNYVINPFGLYPPHFFEPLVLTTRDLKMQLYVTYSLPPQALIMGSSRSFQVDPDQIEHLWGYTAFNASVTGGKLRDYLAFLRYVDDVGKLPDLLIINVAPEVFRWYNDDRSTSDPDSRLWNYVDAQDPLFSLKDNLYRMVRLLSKDQLESSLHIVLLKILNQSDPPRYVTSLNGLTRSPDKHLSSADLIPEKVFNSINSLYFGNTFTEYQPDRYRLDIFQQILEIAKQHHMLVIGYMPPYHPAMRDVLEARTTFPSYLNFVTSQLDNFEKEYPFQYMNFIDSQEFENGNSFFPDLIHPNERASAIMMQELYDQFHSYAQP
jgi:hypothetical protein